MASPSTIRASIQQAKQAWLTGHGQDFAELFSPTGEFIVPGQQWQGPAAILTAFQGYAATHSVNAIVVHNIVIQGDRAMLEWSWDDTNWDTGKRSTADDAIAIDFVGDRIQRWREYIDVTS